jgi:hypothetical protein
MKKHGDNPVRKDMITAAQLLAGGAALFVAAGHSLDFFP